MKNLHLGLFLRASTAVLVAGLAFASAAAQEGGASTLSPEAASDKQAAEIQDIIVTGVLSPRSIEKAPISITAVTSDQINQQALTSAADLLRTVPGVYVNNAFGEIRNIVFSRGVSANSLDGASGYFYVSLQEDGVPVEPIMGFNFGPDYFARPDIMLSRLEALRGGTAAITGPNAPGGIFNYISKTGKSDPGIEVQSKFGLEGNGKNEYYRVDGYAGGELSNGLYYAIGGFYRHSVGARDPGFARNRGGQLRANLLWDYGGGSLKFSAKYLDDRNGFDEFIPAKNFSNPRLAAPYNNTSTTLPGPGARSFTLPDGTLSSWDPSDAVHSQSLAFSADWEHAIGDNWKISNRAGYSRNRSNWNVGALIAASSLNDFSTYLTTGTLGVPGTLALQFSDGRPAATVVSATGFDYTVTANNLPNQSILANGVQTLLGLAYRFRGESFQDTLTLSGQLGDHNVAAGGYYQTGRLSSRAQTSGGALLTLEPNPQFLNMSFTTPLVPGPTFQVTGPGGFANYGLFGGGDGYNGTQDTLSLFLGDSWEVTDRLTIEGGLRYERIQYDITNDTTTNPPSGFGLSGADGNPLTLYDNALGVRGAATLTTRKFDFVNFTGSVAYDFTDSFTAYARYTRGKKAPSFSEIQNIDTPAEIAAIFPAPQTIQQVELGLKFNRGGISIQAFPFWSKLTNVADIQIFVDETGASYTPPPVFGQVETYGIELQTNLQLGRFNWYSAITVQDPKASGYSTWVQNLPMRSDDTLVSIPKGDADNNPKLIIRTTGTVALTDSIEMFATYSYLGKRAANRFNAFYLPGYSTVDIGASWSLGDSFKLQVNVNNLLNNYGILSYSRSGSLLASLDRQALTSADVAAAGANNLLSVIPSQSRAFFLTGTWKIR